MNDDQRAALRALKRTDKARDFPANTCPASRHAQIIGEALAKGWTNAVEDPAHCAESILSTVESLWLTRTECDKLLAELGEARATIDRQMETTRIDGEQISQLLKERDTLAALLREAREFVQADADMMAAITRHAPLDAESQAKHDSTPTTSELLLPKIDAALEAKNADR